jgi:hypothetical protein
MKTYHRASLINEKGKVSALCFSTARAIDLGKASWTNRDEAVTCRKCLALIAAREVHQQEIEVRAQQMIDFANETRDLEDEALDAKRIHGGLTLDEFMAGRE